MKLIKYFKNFLEQEVNLNPSRIKILDERTEAITNFLENSTLFQDNFIDVIPQGSYAHKTIIKPVNSYDEYDADVLLFVEEFEDFEPSDYVETLYSLFRDSAIYRNKVSRKSRCVTITYANDFHMDVVPFLERNDKKWVTNRHKDRFEVTDPEKFTEWLDERGRITKHHFVKVVRIIKYLRDYKKTFSVKSIILNTLLGMQVDDVALMENPKCYDDVPTTLYTIMKKLKDYVSYNYYMPTIDDPGETGENFGDRWDQDGWAIFRSKMIYYADKIIDAYEDQDLNSSLGKWKIIFGEGFKKAETESSNVKQMTDNSYVEFTDTEQTLADKNIALEINPAYKVKLSGRVTKKNGFRTFNLAERGNRVEKKRSVVFSIKTNVPEPYDIYWKVLNRGDDALKNNCIRGQIEKGFDTRTEPTSFWGNHYVECYIVKNGICIAKDRQSVCVI